MPEPTSDDGTVIWTGTLNSSAYLIFQGTGITLYSSCSPTGGVMNVTIDNNTTRVSLWSVELLPVGPVHEITGLNASMQHALKVTFVDGEGIPNAGVNIDKVGVNPAPPSAFPPSRPSPLPPCAHDLSLFPFLYLNL